MKKRLLPGGEPGGQGLLFILREGGIKRDERFLPGSERGLVPFTFPRKRNRGITVLEVVEESVKRIKLVLLERVVFVIVALGTGKGQGEPGRRGGIDAVDHFLGAIQLLVDSGLGVAQGVAVESDRDFLFRRRVGDKVAGELLDAELIVRLVAIDRRHDPVAVAPGPAPFSIPEIPVALTIAGKVEPVPSPALAVVRGGEELFHDFAPGLYRITFHRRRECLDLGG